MQTDREHTVRMKIVKDIYEILWEQSSGPGLRDELNRIGRACIRAAEACLMSKIPGAELAGKASYAAKRGLTEESVEVVAELYGDLLPPLRKLATDGNTTVQMILLGATLWHSQMLSQATSDMLRQRDQADTDRKAKLDRESAFYKKLFEEIRQPPTT